MDTKPKIVLTSETVNALKFKARLKKQNLGLKIYDGIGLKNSKSLYKMG